MAPEPDETREADRDPDPSKRPDAQKPQLELVRETASSPVDLKLDKPGPTHTNSRADLRRRLFGEAWQFAGDQFLQLQTEGIEADARNSWLGLPDAGSYEARALFARIDERLIGDTPDVARVRDSLRNRVLVAAAEARHKFNPPHLRFMTPARMWDEKSFAIASALTPEQVIAAATVQEIHNRERGAPRETRPADARKIPTL